MTVLAVETTMLYCPKCEKTYEEGTQRFCSTEGARLVPVSEENAANQNKEVFTNILKRKTNAAGEKFSSVPKFSQNDSRAFSQTDFLPLKNNNIYKSESEFELELDPLPLEKAVFTKESLAFSEKTAERTDNEQFSEAEKTVSAEELNGQILKKRYRITKLLKKDETGIKYLAEDAEIGDKKVVVKILNESEDSFANQVFAAERASLLQITHSNITNVLDAGELPDGKPFIVCENVDGKTIKDYLDRFGQFNALRTARIVRQTADALGEAHQIGVLHRNLKPENITLFVDENGAERVKVSGFGEAQEKLSEENLLYKSPEQVEGKIANSASDNYALAVIAYQMLTNRLPFNASTVGDLLKAQREGLRMRPSDVRFDLPPQIDEILKRALSFNSFDRYLKTTDFGDEFFSEIIANAPLDIEEEPFEKFIESAAKPDETPVESVEAIEPAEEKSRLLPLEEINVEPVVKTAAVNEIQQKKEAVQDSVAPDKVKATKDLAWEKRSLDNPTIPGPRRNLLAILGIGVLIASLFGVWYYFINRSANKITPPANQTVNQNVLPNEIPATNGMVSNTEPLPEEVEAPPLPRSIRQPPNTVYFQNSKENLKGDAMKNFLGFSLYYPNDWQVNSIEPDLKELKSRSKFLDISKSASSGTPIEQMLISYYNSKGTFKTDQEISPELVRESNDTLKKIVPNYQMISEGKITVNNGWQAYELKFQGTGTTASGEKIVLWGRRLFIPTAIRGMKNGYVITMLATSLSEDVKNIHDVGVKGELSVILETFEPNQIL